MQIRLTQIFLGYFENDLENMDDYHYLKIFNFFHNKHIFGVQGEFKKKLKKSSEDLNDARLYIQK